MTPTNVWHGRAWRCFVHVNAPCQSHVHEAGIAPQRGFPQQSLFIQLQDLINSEHKDPAGIGPGATCIFATCLPSGNFTVCYWTWPIEILDFNLSKIVIFHSFLYVYQRVNRFNEPEPCAAPLVRAHRDREELRRRSRSGSTGMWWKVCTGRGTGGPKDRIENSMVTWYQYWIILRQIYINK